MRAMWEYAQEGGQGMQNRICCELKIDSRAGIRRLNWRSRVSPTHTFFAVDYNITAGRKNDAFRQ